LTEEEQGKIRHLLEEEYLLKVNSAQKRLLTLNVYKILDAIVAYVIARVYLFAVNVHVPMLVHVKARRKPWLTRRSKEIVRG
jgi:hypothetical protein